MPCRHNLTKAVVALEAFLLYFFTGIRRNRMFRQRINATFSAPPHYSSRDAFKV